jgi:hypothetical protein
MSDAYRSDEAALRLQVDALREQMAAASEDASEQERIRTELEEALEALKQARLSEAEKSVAARRVRGRGIALGLALGVLTVGTFGAAYVLYDHQSPASAAQPPSAATWFERARQHCNPVEASNYIRKNPAPADDPQSLGYTAACFALAHRIDDARAVLRTADSETRSAAIQTVFRIVHPVADAGDDVAAGPVMELVLEFWPGNYMAVFHAGMAAYANKDDDRARRHLERFMTIYKKKDGWNQRATRALDIIQRTEDGENVARPKIGAH